MNPIDKFRYLDPRDKRRLFAFVGLMFAAVMITSTLVVTRCNRAVDVNTGRLDTAEQDTLTQLRESFFAVGTALAGDPPAPTVADAVRSVASEKGAAALKSKVGGTPLKFNPKKADWSFRPPAGGGVPANAGSPPVLVVGPAPESYRSRNVVLIGVARGGLPVEITAGSEPDWLPSAVVAPD
jgi:hypothetical protein